MKFTEKSISLKKNLKDIIGINRYHFGQHKIDLKPYNPLKTIVKYGTKIKLRAFL